MIEAIHSVGPRTLIQLSLAYVCRLVVNTGKPIHNTIHNLTQGPIHNLTQGLLNHGQLTWLGDNISEY